MKLTTDFLVKYIAFMITVFTLIYVMQGFFMLDINQKQAEREIAQQKRDLIEHEMRLEEHKLRIEALRLQNSKSGAPPPP